MELKKALNVFLTCEAGPLDIHEKRGFRLLLYSVCLLG